MDRGYPAHWEADVVLRDGGTARIRPIRPDDAERLLAFHSRLSEQTIYYRFFAPYPQLTPHDVRRFTNVDYDNRVALVATVGEHLIGVVRYDRVGRTEAEVAFNIEDAHQGRGLGSVMLEHIAAAARERGIDRFVAEVLPANRKMLAVFQEAGYAVTPEFEDGVVRLEFAIAPTEKSLAVMAAREHRAEARSVQRLLRPGSVAVIGASRDEGSIGRVVLTNLRAGGFNGPVHAVNPNTVEVAGEIAYSSLTEVPGAVDLGVIAVPAESVGGVVLDCARKGMNGLLVLSAGFGEDGAEGAERQRDLVATAHAHGMRLIGPNSFGIINTDPEIQLNATLSSTMPPRGRIGFFSQSGALGIALLESVARRGLGLSTFVSAGNRADVSGNDLLQYWEEDADTDIVLLYLESIGNPRKFSRLARRVSREKPIVAVKAGRSTQGVPLGHPVRPSRAPAAAVDAMFQQAGVIRVADIHQLFDVAQVLAMQPLPRGDRVAVLSNSVALGLLAADACEENRLTLAHPPVQVGSQAATTDFGAALRALLADPEVDSVVAVFIPPLRVLDEDVAREVATASAESDKTVVGAFHGMRGIPEQLSAGAPGHVVPSYPTPDDAVRALAGATWHSRWKSRPSGTLPDLTGVDTPAARAFLARVLAGAPDGRELTVPEITELLSCYSIEVPETISVGSADQAGQAADRLGYPVVLKASSPRHRLDLGDVRLNLEDGRQVRSAYASLLTTLGPNAGSNLVVQRMATIGVPCEIASMEDPLFGPILSFGLSGVATELLGDRSYRIPPLTDVDAADMVRDVSAAPLLFGYREADAVDVAALEQLLLRVSRLADDLPEVAGLELDPVLAARNGLTVLTASARISPPQLRIDRGPRRLFG